MRQLYPQFGDAVRFAKIGDSLYCRFIFVTVKTETTVRDAPFRRHMGSLEYQQAGRTHGKLAVVHEMPVVCRTVFSHVLTHGRDSNAVG